MYLFDTVLTELHTIFYYDQKMKFVLKGRIRCIFRVFPGPFYCSRGPSLVELTGNDNNAARAVAVIRMTLKEYAWPSHILYIAEYGATAGEVANPARGQLNRKNEYFSVCPRSRLIIWPFLRDAFGHPVFLR